jgi:membrane protein insertase Oxa1/YidC/SpoIIIJ
MQALEIILNPIIWLMELILRFYESITSSIGIAILLLSVTFSLFLLPLQKSGRRIEQRVSNKMKAANIEVQALKGDLKGEKLFLATERIYKNHGYHPIQSIALGLSFFVMLPVLLSAILLLTGDAILAGKSFLVISDLSKSDKLLGIINLLPILMLAITLIDAKLRFQDDKKSQHRFFFIALVLLILVYNLPAGLVLYWTGSNMVSLILSRKQAKNVI